MFGQPAIYQFQRTYRSPHIRSVEKQIVSQNFDQSETTHFKTGPYKETHFISLELNDGLHRKLNDFYYYLLSL